MIEMFKSCTYLFAKERHAVATEMYLLLWSLTRENHHSFANETVPTSDEIHIKVLVQQTCQSVSQSVKSVRAVPRRTFLPSAELMCGLRSGQRVTVTVIHFSTIISDTKGIASGDTWQHTHKHIKVNNIQSSAVHTVHGTVCAADTGQ